ncbi:MAG: M48 family metallopeptidase [Deltaproteobacteria bacterium]|nr:M48 family metallopeptidase [Deltaproteobacteria bacterium]
MITIRGKWYDGRTSFAAEAVMTVYGSGEVRVEAEQGGELLAARPRFDMKAGSRLAETPRYLLFQDGGKFETEDNEAVDMALARFRPSVWSGLVHRLESRWPYVLVALIIMAAFLWGGVKYGVPFTAEVIADRLPPSAYRVASRQTLSVLDRSLLRPSELDEAIRARLRNHFRPILQDHPEHDFTILFRKGGRLGPNAFALPDGTILFTDEMVRIAGHDDELAAVLTHEIGHVVHRHGMRRVVQDSLLGFALLALTGDVSGSSEIFLSLPVILTELAYSREFEREADDFALSYLRSEGIPPAHFARLMKRIQKKAAAKGKTGDNGWMSYLSTHPALEERIRRFDGFAKTGSAAAGNVIID